MVVSLSDQDDSVRTQAFTATYFESNAFRRYIFSMTEYEVGYDLPADPFARLLQHLTFFEQHSLRTGPSSLQQEGMCYMKEW